jgi:hypothetical protein
MPGGYRYVTDDGCHGTMPSVVRRLLPCRLRHRVYWGLPRLSKQHPQDAFLWMPLTKMSRGALVLAPGPLAGWSPAPSRSPDTPTRPSTDAKPFARPFTSMLLAIDTRARRVVGDMVAKGVDDGYCRGPTIIGTETYAKPCGLDLPPTILAFP